MSDSSSPLDLRYTNVKDGIAGIGKNYGPINFVSQPKQRPHTKNLPYRADRTQQVRQTRAALEDHYKSNPRRPILFIAHGPEAQCPESLSVRLRDDVLPGHLNALLGTDVCKVIDNVGWPLAGKRPVETRVQEYHEGLAGKLVLRVASSYPEIRKWIANQRSPVVLRSAHTEVAGEDDDATLRAVLDYWARMDDLDADLTLIVVLAFTYAEPRPSLFDRIRGKTSRSSLATKLVELGSYSPDRLRVVVLPELESLKLQDAEDWVREVLESFDIDTEQTLRRARSFFDPIDASIPMETLAGRLNSLIPKDRELFRQL